MCISLTFDTVLVDGQLFNSLLSKITWYSEIIIESTYIFALMGWLLQYFYLPAPEHEGMNKL